MFDPIKGRVDLGTQLIKQARLAAPSGVFSDQHQPERRGINRPIVRRVRYLAQVRHLAYAQLVQNLAGLLLSPWVKFFTLIFGQQTDSVLGNAYVVSQRL